ncbi:hypothetical protein AK812_SmicGene1263 [Symbiodinium microadriaticum]|uniref:Uncharacterized protein n=1 Tax=Symbiodinium microadriaticum TaxID=2951 RepID=A0A1Q9F4H5_SYMMI|nr:hypothetical protein AK812_SmicGene1263 [Symbiodinium microadriaticum]
MQKMPACYVHEKKHQIYKHSPCDQYEGALGRPSCAMELKNTCRILGAVACAPDRVAELAGREMLLAFHGIVMLDEHSGWVGNDRERFEDARRKAVATHSIPNSGEPVFLRWATEEEFVGAPNSYHNKAALFIALVTLIYTSSTATLVWLLSSTLRVPAPRGKLDLPPLVPKATH